MCLGMTFSNSNTFSLSRSCWLKMHACLRTVLAQGKAWGIIRVNPSQGVRLPRKNARKPPVLLAKPDIRRVIRVAQGRNQVFDFAVQVGERRPSVLQTLWEDVTDRVSTDSRPGLQQEAIGWHNLYRVIPRIDAGEQGVVVHDDLFECKVSRISCHVSVRHQRYVKAFANSLRIEVSTQYSVM